MKILNRKLDFTDKTQWAWPEGDDKLALVFEHVMDIDLTMRYVKNTGTVLQAGGATGVWPYRYSQLFERVITCEPMPQNRECLIENIKGIGNIEVLPYALSDRAQNGVMKFPDRPDNYGAVYFDACNGDIEAITIDSLGLEDCDLIQLDIEGHEYKALYGGIDTIVKYKPVVVLEEKPLQQLCGKDYKAPRKLLESLGYKQINAVHRDVIFVC